ncbi:secA translation cis-regulator SecM [Spirabiliibacterium falconis]|uniref:secA translation cis-regulator SecM n=1 Tax=Spirabiliibacterium falconis TaxID=572023 RepID=UPI001AAD0DCF|nr:secA translation cis-regulator SecM [Spirabiliibacterium falconis]MBE2894932.1 DUF2547 family protein [Spirabiliibacterium falconis]
MYRSNTKPHFWSQLWLGIIAIFSVSVNAQPSTATEYRQVYHVSQQCVHQYEQGSACTPQLNRTLPQRDRSQVHFLYAYQQYSAPDHRNAPIRAGPQYV